MISAFFTAILRDVAPSFVAAGPLATLAFLVVFRVLIRLFFSMDIASPLGVLKFCLWQTLLYRAGLMPNLANSNCPIAVLKMRHLVLKYCCPGVPGRLNFSLRSKINLTLVNF
jgi:hypothetical protein